MSTPCLYLMPSLSPQMAMILHKLSLSLITPSFLWMVWTPIPEFWKISHNNYRSLSTSTWIPTQSPPIINWCLLLL